MTKDELINYLAEQLISLRKEMTELMLKITELKKSELLEEEK